MEAKAILVGCGKGGTGKTTIATSLAARLAMRDRVKLLDADPQQSALKWSKRRRRAGLDDIAASSFTAAIGARRLRRLVRSDADVTIIDVSGRDSAEFRMSLAVCDVAILPLRPSQADVETSSALFDTVCRAAALNPALLARVLLTQAPPYSWTTELDEARQLLGKWSEGMPVLNAAIFARKAYRTALAEGVGVHELPSRTGGKAAAEIAAVASEVMDLFAARSAVALALTAEVGRRQQA